MAVLRQSWTLLSFPGKWLRTETKPVLREEEVAQLLEEFLQCIRNSPPWRTFRIRSLELTAKPPPHRRMAHLVGNFHTSNRPRSGCPLDLEAILSGKFETLASAAHLEIDSQVLMAVPLTTSGV